jgi:hypothetical protein
MRLACCLIACLSAAAAQAIELQGSPELRAWQAETAERQWQHAERLASRGDARSLMQALIVGMGKGTPQAAQRHAHWSDSLRGMPIADAEHAWWHYRECRLPGADCSDAPPLQILAQLDPDNLWTQLLLARAAQREKRPSEALEWLQLATQADAESSLSRMAALISNALDGLQLPEPDAAVAAELGQKADGSPGMAYSAESYRWVMAMGLLVAHALPEYSSLTQLCRPDPQAPLDAAWRQACLAVAGRVGRQDPSVIGGVVGLALAAQFAREGAEATVWREAYRRFRFFYSVGTSATLELEQDADAMVDYLKDVFVHGERPALQRLLQRRGQPIEPPPDWLPEDARGRSLILGEAEPAA